MAILNWLLNQIVGILQWLIEKGAVLILHGVGGFSRFMTEQCHEAFLLFGLIGIFFIMANGKKIGTRMINLSFLLFIIMKVLGVCL